MDRKELAAQYRAQNYNCAQSVFCAFEDLTGLDRETSLAICEGLGGGFRCGEICAAPSEAVAAIGLIIKNKGESVLRNEKVKEITNEFTKRFTETEGHLTCRDLLASSEVKLCGKYIADAVEILESILEEKGI